MNEKDLLNGRCRSGISIQGAFLSLTHEREVAGGLSPHSEMPIGISM